MVFALAAGMAVVIFVAVTIGIVITLLIVGLLKLFSKEDRRDEKNGLSGD